VLVALSARAQARLFSYEKRRRGRLVHFIFYTRRHCSFTTARGCTGSATGRGSLRRSRTRCSIWRFPGVSVPIHKLRSLKPPAPAAGGPSKRPQTVDASSLVRGVVADPSEFVVSHRQALANAPLPVPSTQSPPHEDHGHHGRTCATRSISTAAPAMAASWDQLNPSRAWLKIERLIYDPTSRPCLARGKPLVLESLLTSGFLFTTPPLFSLLQTEDSLRRRYTLLNTHRSLILL
jgi:hypothetical protein